MANPDRGEVDLVVSDTTYVLRLTTNGIRTLQARTKRTYGALLNDLSTLDVDGLVEVLFQALQPYHAKDFRTVDQVGNLIDAHGSYLTVMPTIKALITANRPPASEETGGDTHPPVAPMTDGTGAPSTDAPVPSV